MAETGTTTMKILFAIPLLAFALHAEDAQPLATVEQFTPKTVLSPGDAEYNKLLSAFQVKDAKVAEQSKQIAEQAAELRLYQQGLFQCQAAEIHQQAVSQAQQSAKHPPLAPTAPVSPPAKDQK